MLCTHPATDRREVQNEFSIFHGQRLTWKGLLVLLFLSFLPVTKKRRFHKNLVWSNQNGCHNHIMIFDSTLSQIKNFKHLYHQKIWLNLELPFSSVLMQLEIHIRKKNFLNWFYILLLWSVFVKCKWKTIKLPDSSNIDLII